MSWRGLRAARLCVRARSGTFLAGALAGDELGNLFRLGGSPERDPTKRVDDLPERGITETADTGEWDTEIGWPIFRTHD